MRRFKFVAKTINDDDERDDDDDNDTEREVCFDDVSDGYMYYVILCLEGRVQVKSIAYVDDWGVQIFHESVHYY